MHTSKDFSPLYRSFIGFEQLANLIEKATNQDKRATYPPFNIELISENVYMITMAVAGFTDEEIDIERKDNTLTIVGSKAKHPDMSDKPERTFLHQGIAERGFERAFQLDEHVKVASVCLHHGMLKIGLERQVPEASQPQKFKIDVR